MIERLIGQLGDPFACMTNVWKKPASRGLAKAIT